MEQFFIKLVLFKNDFNFDIFLVAHNSLLDVSLLELFLDLLFQDLLLSLEDLLLSDFSHFLLLFSLLEFGNMGLEFGVYGLLFFNGTVSGCLFGFEIRFFGLDIVLFHEVLFLLISKFGVLFHLELLVGPIGTSGKLT